jgi:cell division septation protein DedD
MAGGWSVQVGAFSSENLARNAATQAKDTVATIGSRVVISPVQQGRTTLYRARVTGLSQSAAQSACDRLRGKGGCSVVAPGA